jgi:hypothetical protein
VLFRGPYEEPARSDWPRDYAVSPDGQRFVMIRGEQEAPTQVHVVLSRREELQHRSQAR